MLSVIKELEQLADEAGLEVKQFGEHHFQIRGGENLINYYPLSKKRTAYIANTNQGLRYVDPERAISLAFELPEAGTGAKTKRKKRDRRLKHKLFKKQDRKCYWCHERMLMTTDGENPKQATYEHVIPLSKGGLDHHCNIVLVHKKCNR